MIELISTSCEQTEQLGEKLAKTLSGTEIIAMFGNLGAGKTAFTRGLCRGLGVTNNVCSPTFAIVNEYAGKFRVFHFDMYRVSTLDDLHSTGYFDYLDTGVLIIEWSENIETILPEDTIRVTITYGTAENERIICVEGANLSENFSD